MIVDDVVHGRAEITEPVMLDLISSRAFQRLKGISNIGIPREFIPKEEPDFSRYDHCVGVMLLLRRLGASLEEQVAGLLHDVSHTAFSHVVDYVLKSDGSAEDYQDSIHRSFFADGTELASILQRHGLDPARISEPKNYSLLEQEQPEMCADRFDYTARYWGLDGDTAFVREVVDAVTSMDGVMVFCSLDAARDFGYRHMRMFLEGAHDSRAEIPVRWEVFAGALRVAIRKGIISKDDFLGTDAYVMDKLAKANDADVMRLFGVLRGPCRFTTSNDNPKVALRYKFRYTDPGFIDRGSVRRVSDADPAYKAKIEGYRSSKALWPGIASIEGVELPIR